MKRILAASFLGILFFMSASPVFAQGTATANAVTGPQKDSMCWTLEQCRDRYTEAAASNPNWVFATNSFISNKEECGAANLGYCYAPTISYDLIVDVGAVTRVQGIGGYIEALYSLAIVVGSIGVVLSIMIAGLRWMVARGDTGAAGAAKEMIGKAIVSMVILLSIVTLANLVDPSLTVLNPLRVPLIKQVNYIPENTSCEALQEEPFKMKVTPSTGKCGEKGKIDDLGEQGKGGATSVGLEVGDECTFRGCGGTAESCIQASGSWKCIRCGEVSDTSGHGIEPSPSACSRFSIEPSVQDLLDKRDIFRACTYFNAGWLDGLSYDSCVEYAYPFGVGALDCPRLRVEAGNHCNAYVDVTAYTTNNIFHSAIDTYDGANNDYPLVKELCNADPCKLAPPGQTCGMRLDKGYFWSDVACINSGYNGSANTLLDATGAVVSL